MHSSWFCFDFTKSAPCYSCMCFNLPISLTVVSLGVGQLHDYIALKTMSRHDARFVVIIEVPQWKGPGEYEYRQTSNIRRTVVGNKIVDHSDVVGVSPVGAAPTTFSLSIWHLASRRDEKHFSFGICAFYIRGLTIVVSYLTADEQMQQDANHVQILWVILAVSYCQKY